MCLTQYGEGKEVKLRKNMSKTTVATNRGEVEARETKVKRIFSILTKQL